MENLVRDIGYELRLLRRGPGFASFAAATLALGIAASTAVFSVLNAAFLSGLAIALGLVAAAAVTRLLASQLFGVKL